MNIDEYVNNLDEFLSARCKLIRVVVDLQNVVTVTVSRGEPVPEIERQVREFIASQRERDLPRVKVEEGAEHKEFLGRIDEHPPVKIDSRGLIVGGDACGNSQKPGYYGTLSFAVRGIRLEVKGKCNFVCEAAPALVSNNHVIGRSDAGQAGEQLWASGVKDFGTLNCLVPFSCKPDVDLATGIVRDITLAETWTVRDIGRLNNERRPNVGERVRKYGARTGFRQGVITHKGTTHVNGNIFYGVFYVSGGFSCPGDSGSSVVADDGNLLGILSWGETKECDQDPYGIFWPIVNPGTLRKSGSSSTIRITREATTVG